MWGELWGWGFELGTSGGVALDELILQRAQLFALRWKKMLDSKTLRSALTIGCWTQTFSERF